MLRSLNNHMSVLEEDDNDAPKRSKRQRVEKSFGDDFIVYLVDDTPTTIAEAFVSLDADHWKEAVHNEMDSILSNGMWEVTDQPYGCKHVQVPVVNPSLRCAMAEYLQEIRWNVSYSEREANVEAKMCIRDRAGYPLWKGRAFFHLP